MSIKKLIGFLEGDNKNNIAEDIDEDTLMKVANQVIEDYDRDMESMTDWSNLIEEGRKVAEQETNTKSDPWEGASNFKSPAIIEASITFGDRAATEVLRGRNLVKADIIGADTEKTKKKASENVVEFMNWQINHQMHGWRKTQEKLLYEIPSTGHVFKKVFFCPIEGINKSELLHYPDFAINQATTCMRDCKSFTHPMDFDVDEVFERQSAGLWLDVDLYPDNAEGDEGSNEEQDVIDTVDNPDLFLEQNCFYDLDGDKYREPYTITVHKKTRQVVRIVPRYDITRIFAKDKAGAISRMDSFDTTGLSLVRIEPLQNIVSYDFIPSMDGTFLGMGYYHLLTSLSKGSNTTTNQLMDSGTLANLQGGFLARGFRKRMGNLRVKPGQWEDTNISPADLANGIQPHKFKEPSAVLFALNEKMDQQIQQLVVSTDMKGVLAPNAPATTTLALIQEAMLPMSAILQRIIMSESEEFKLFFMLNSQFTSPQTYQEVLDDDAADFKRDFSVASFDVIPTANAEMSSRMQRIQRAETLALEAPNIALEGGDTRPIRNAWFDAIGAPDMIDEVFPDPEDMNDEQRGRIQAQQEQQRQQAQLMAIQVDHAEREITRKELETKAKLSETASQIRKIQSEIILNLEKAETEETKNRITTYTTQLNAVTTAIDNTIKEMDADNVQRLSRQPATAALPNPNIPG